MNLCCECKYYQPINITGGICCLQIATGKENRQPADGHDDLVNAAEGSCSSFQLKKNARICMKCAHYEKSAVYGLGICDIVNAAGSKMRVAGTDTCKNYEYPEGCVFV